MNTCTSRLGNYLELAAAHGQGDEVMEELLLVGVGKVTHVTRQHAVEGAAVPANDVTV